MSPVNNYKDDQCIFIPTERPRVGLRSWGGGSQPPITSQGLAGRALPAPPVIDNVTDLESARIWRWHQLSRIMTDFYLCKYNALSEDWRHYGVSVRIRARF